MKTCKYLYGVDVANWHDAPYDIALQMKNIFADRVIMMLLSRKLVIWTRIKDCRDAITHNERLLNE